MTYDSDTMSLVINVSSSITAQFATTITYTHTRGKAYGVITVYALYKQYRYTKGSDNS